MVGIYPEPVKEFVVYTVLRLLLFAASFAIVAGIWLAVSDNVPLLWVFVIAFVVSGWRRTSCSTARGSRSPSASTSGPAGRRRRSRRARRARTSTEPPQWSEGSPNATPTSRRRAARPCRPASASGR